VAPGFCLYLLGLFNNTWSSDCSSIATLCSIHPPSLQPKPSSLSIWRSCAKKLNANIRYMGSHRMISGFDVSCFSHVLPLIIRSITARNTQYTSVIRVPMHKAHWSSHHSLHISILPRLCQQQRHAYRGTHRSGCLRWRGRRPNMQSNAAAREGRPLTLQLQARQQARDLLAALCSGIRDSQRWSTSQNHQIPCPSHHHRAVCVRPAATPEFVSIVCELVSCTSLTILLTSWYTHASCVQKDGGLAWGGTYRAGIRCMSVDAALFFLFSSVYIALSNSYP
jgi:hypothetical protein